MNRTRIQLIERARLRPHEALGELCMVYHNYLYVVARSALGAKLALRVEPSDVVQEVLVEVVRQFARFPGTTGTEFARWLRRLVGQKIADLGRHHHSIKRGGGKMPISIDASVQAGESGEDSNRLLDALASAQSDPREIVNQRELGGKLAEALAKLPKCESDVIMLYYVEELSFEAIGRRIGKNGKFVRSLWTRGMNTLRRNLEGPPGGSLRYEGQAFVRGFGAMNEGVPPRAMERSA